jgi:hypothetical protein
VTDKFAYAAQQLALKGLERDLVEAGRMYEDAEQEGDAATAAYAMQTFNAKQLEIKELRGENEPQPEISAAQQQFLDRRAALGDDWRAPNRRQDYVQAHIRAVGAGWPIDSPGYFSCISRDLDHGGDGRSAVPDERSAASYCQSKYGQLSDQEYAQQAQKLAWLRQRGLHD